MCSLFKVLYKEIDPLQQKIVAQTILDYLKNLKDNFIPKMKLSTTSMLFDHVRYGDTAYLHLEIENEGDGLLEYQITKIKDPEVRAALKGKKRRHNDNAWLMISPLRGVIKSGEKKQITFRI